MERSNKLFKNIIVFLIASFLPKFFSFLLVPLYTSFLTTEAYGTAEVLNTIYALAIPIFLLDIPDAVMLRTAEEKKTAFFSAPLQYGFRILVKATFVLLAVLCCVLVFFQNEDLPAYCLYILLQFIFSGINRLLLAYLRGLEDSRTIARSGLINSFTVIISNLVFVAVLRAGLSGLLVSSLLGVVVSDIYMLIKTRALTACRAGQPFSGEEKRKMRLYSIPLIFAEIAWWINTSSDRVFISALAGVAATGIYSIANKIPLVIQVFQTAVSQALQLSVLSEKDAKDREEYFVSMYSVYSFVIMLMGCVLIALDKPIADLLYKGEFFVAWKYSPALVISIGIFSIAMYLTNVYSVEKKTGTTAVSTVIGAVLNSALNMVLIPPFGLYGAVIATITGNLAIWLYTVIRSKKVLGFQFPLWKNLLMYSLLMVQWYVILKADHSYLYSLLVAAVIVLANIRELKTFLKLVLQFFVRNDKKV